MALLLRYSQQAQWNIRDSKVPWVKFEQDSITPSFPELTIKNQVVAIGLKLWNQYKTKYNLISQTPLGASYLGDPRFPSAYDHPESFLAWTEHNLTTLRDFLVDSKFITFSAIKSLFHIPDREFYSFLQIRHFFQQHYINPPPRYQNTF